MSIIRFEKVAMTTRNHTDEEEASGLRNILLKLDKVFPARVLTTLRAAATPAELAVLGSALPYELQTLLLWHDGQAWNSPLSKNDNRRLLSASEISEERAFFADPMSDFTGSWSNSWFPVLTNDSGDFVVYETDGPLMGKLLHYWHDDESRSVAYPSLAQWAESLLREYEV